MEFAILRTLDATTIEQVSELLKDSQATAPFKEAVAHYLSGRDSDLIRHNRGVPRIKILRVIAKLLEQYPDEAISEIHIDGVSSCSRFYGTLTFGPGGNKIEFNWDCTWKAIQEGMQTWYGAPDQSKAAQTFGYQCFETFKRIDYA